MNFLQVKKGYFIVLDQNRTPQYIIQTYPFTIFNITSPVSLRRLKQHVATFPEIPHFRNGYPKYFSLEFILSSDCNLACAYCFAKESGTGYYGLPRKNMPQRVVKCAVDFALNKLVNDILSLHDTCGFFDVYFMGGEPLMNTSGLFFALEYIKRRTKQIKEKLKVDIIVQAAISSNITLLDRKTVLFFKKYNFNYIGVTIDGKAHDRFRVYRDGRGTLTDITRKIRLLYKAGVRVKLLSVVPPGEVKHIPSIINFYKSLGILDGAYRVSIVPKAPALTDTDRMCVMPKKYIAKLNAQAASYEYSDHEKKVFADHIVKMQARENIDERDLAKKMNDMVRFGGSPTHCSAGIGKISVTPDGSIYPCHQFVNRKQFYMGNVAADSQKEYNRIRSIFLSRTFDRIDACSTCILQSVCPPLVDCPARSYYEKGSLYKTPQYCGIYYPYLLSNFSKIVKRYANQ